MTLGGSADEQHLRRRDHRPRFLTGRDHRMPSRPSSRPILAAGCDRSGEFPRRLSPGRSRAVQGGALWWRSQGRLTPTSSRCRAGRRGLTRSIGTLQATSRSPRRSARRLVSWRDRGRFLLRRRSGGAAAHDLRNRPQPADASSSTPEAFRGDAGVSRRAGRRSRADRCQGITPDQAALERGSIRPAPFSVISGARIA